MKQQPKSPPYDYTERKSIVDNIPDWAQDYEIGDEIHWETDEVSGTQTSEVVGFSTLYDISYPVIEAPYETYDREKGHVETCAVTEHEVLKLVDESEVLD